MDKRAEYFKNRYKERRAAGLCVKCGAPAKPGRTRCAMCTELDKRQMGIRRKKALDAGLCPKCKRPLDNETMLCQACREANNACTREHRAMLRAQGLCPKCAKRPPAKGRKVCEVCAERHRFYYRRQIFASWKK